MTIRYRVQQWVSQGGSFRDGVGLLEMAGDRAANRYRSVLSQQFVSAAQKEHLRKEMVRLLGSLPEDSHPAPPASAGSVEQRIPDTPRIIAMRKQARGFLKQRSDLKTQLIVKGLDNLEKYTDEERLAIAKAIMEDNVPELDVLYDQIRRFEQEGIEPADDEEMIRQDTVAKMKKVYSLRPQISRLRGALKKGGLTNQEKSEKEVELAEKLAELEQIEDFLGL